MNEKLNSEIDAAIDALKSIKTWIRDKEKDEKRDQNIAYWMSVMLSNVEAVARKIVGGQYD